jgi:hypothetical protein
MAAPGSMSALACWRQPRITPGKGGRTLADLRLAILFSEFYKKGYQEKSFPLDRTPRKFLSRDPAHCL